MSHDSLMYLMYLVRLLLQGLMMGPHLVFTLSNPMADCSGWQSKSSSGNWSHGRRLSCSWSCNAPAGMLIYLRHFLMAHFIPFVLGRLSARNDFYANSRLICVWCLWNNWILRSFVRKLNRDSINRKIAWLGCSFHPWGTCQTNSTPLGQVWMLTFPDGPAMALEANQLDF